MKLLPISEATLWYDLLDRELEAAPGHHFDCPVRATRCDADSVEQVAEGEKVEDRHRELIGQGLGGIWLDEVQWNRIRCN